VPRPRPPYGSPPPHILAHRGLALHAPENTLAAFAAALEAGADVIETDVRGTADGVPVLLHDPLLLAEGAAAAVPIAGLRSEELAGLRLAGGHPVPTLAEALERFPDTPFNIDVKSADVAAEVGRIVAAHRSSSRILLTSFSRARQRAAVRRAPGVSLSASPVPLVLLCWLAACGLWPLARLFAGRICAVQRPDAERALPRITARFIHGCHRAGIEVHVWTVNDEQRMRELYALGVDAVVTDRADLAARVLGWRPTENGRRDGSKNPA